jgi:hypothetical protein
MGPDTAWLAVLIAAVGSILIPVLVLVIQTARRSGAIEQKLSDLAESETEQNRRVSGVFTELDRRVRWLEERIWGTDPRFPRRR